MRPMDWKRPVAAWQLPRDFAKFGRLYLNQGKWQGKQIVPQDWVDAANQSDLSIGSAWNY